MQFADYKLAKTTLVILPTTQQKLKWNEKYRTDVCIPVYEFVLLSVPPRIHYVSHTGPLEVLQGATVKMECRASGNPVPTVAWTRKNNVLPSGERSVSGLSLVIQHADRHSAGQYQCSADNGVGQPDTRHITLNVLCKYSGVLL
jgi:hypothetical protein